MKIKLLAGSSPAAGARNKISGIGILIVPWPSKPKKRV